jgi:signal transduction histidine kinase
VVEAGKEMSPKTVARLFEPFYTTKDPERGTGLGVVVVHDIIHRHAGVVEVSSEPGLGSSLTLLLPIQSEPSPKAASKPAPISPKAPSEPT